MKLLLLNCDYKYENIKEEKNEKANVHILSDIREYIFKGNQHLIQLFVFNVFKFPISEYKRLRIRI